MDNISYRINVNANGKEIIRDLKKIRKLLKQIGKQFRNMKFKITEVERVKKPNRNIEAPPNINIDMG